MSNETPEHFRTFEKRLELGSELIVSGIQETLGMLFFRGAAMALLAWMMMVILGAYGLPMLAEVIISLMLFMAYLVYYTVHAMHLYQRLLIPLKAGQDEDEKQRIALKIGEGLQRRLQKEVGRWGIVYRQRFWEILGFSLMFNVPLIPALIAGSGEWFVAPAGMTLTFVVIWILYIPLVELSLLIMGKPKTAG